MISFVSDIDCFLQDPLEVKVTMAEDIVPLGVPEPLQKEQHCTAERQSTHVTATKGRPFKLTLHHKAHLPIHCWNLAASVTVQSPAQLSPH